MIRHLSADFVITAVGDPIRDGVVSVDDKGRITAVRRSSEDPALSGEKIERLTGLIVPGFINTHCHLELSHMNGLIPGGGGLIPFLTEVISKRSAAEDLIMNAMLAADKEMIENGIAAVGDISNNILSRSVKKASSIYYHTFVELIGFDPSRAAEAVGRGTELLAAFHPLKASLAAHAPYSISKELLRLMIASNAGHSELTSMHNQESADENELYRYKTGAFLDFYKNLNINVDFFKAQARNSFQSLLPLFPPRQRVLLVHNTYTSLKDIYFADRFNRDIHWCFCPKANLYIEGRLPKIDLFRTHEFNITVGTDSLASNDKLCILSELQAIHSHFPYLSFAETIRWATINGAKFLGIEDAYGSISVGKSPGLNLITNHSGAGITAGSRVKKLI